MNDAKDYALTIVDAIERLWMQNKAMEIILDQYQIPNWFELVEHFCAQEGNQRQAQQRFAPARALLQSSLTDSKALAELSKALQQNAKPN